MKIIIPDNFNYNINKHNYSLYIVVKLTKKAVLKKMYEKSKMILDKICMNIHRSYLYTIIRGVGGVTFSSK